GALRQDGLIASLISVIGARTSSASSSRAKGARMRTGGWIKPPFRVWDVLVLATACLTMSMAVHAPPIDRLHQFQIIVGGGIGGGYDFYGRMVARYMSRYLPGNPNFVSQSMPGAGGMIAANYLYNIAPRDGSEIGIVGRAVGTQPLLDPNDKAPKYV